MVNEVDPVIADLADLKLLADQNATLRELLRDIVLDFGDTCHGPVDCDCPIARARREAELL